MIPLKDRNPTSRLAVVTIVLIAVNVGVFVFVQRPFDRSLEVVPTARGQVRISHDTRFTLEEAAIPCEVTQGRPLNVDEVVRTFNQGDDSACESSRTAPRAGGPLFPGKHVWLALLFSMFLHASWTHLGFNMLFLWIFGNNIEDHLGRVRYLAFYLLGGFVASLSHVLVQPSSTVPVIGASGAIAAVMGAYLIWFPTAPVVTLFLLIFIPVVRDISARWWLLIWFGLQFLTGPNSGVAWVAHVGGFLFGILIGLVVRASDRARSVAWRTPDTASPQRGGWDSTGSWGRQPQPPPPHERSYRLPWE